MPKYFVAVFGFPEPGKDTVESGVYTPDPKYAPFPAKPGDILLLYCTDAYTKYSKSVPGIGVVLRVDNQHVVYRWLPLLQPVPKARLDDCFDADEASKMRLIWQAYHWLFEVSSQSFTKIVEGRSIAWANL